MGKEGELLERAIQIAMKAHAGQTDRNGAPYILHPLRVMQRMDTLREKMVAVLHDVIEDSQWSAEDLRREGFPEDIVAAVDALTKREGEDYEEFVRRSTADQLARRVKLADLEDNMDLRRLKTVTPEDAPRLAKYLKAWKYLTHPGNEP